MTLGWRLNTGDAPPQEGSRLLNVFYSDRSMNPPRTLKSPVTVIRRGEMA